MNNEQLQECLQRMVEKDAVGNSLLFLGPDSVTGSAAIELARMVISRQDPTGKQLQKIADGTHPDIHIYKPAGKLGLHSIESMRQFGKEVYLPPYEAKAKFFIIHDADRMLPSSSNALLKTFEEPSLDSIIILLAGSKEGFLTTVLSRCRVITFESTRKQSPIDSPLRKLVLDALSSSRLPYTEIQELSSQVSEVVDSMKSEVEKQARAEIMEGFSDNLNAVQKEAIEKEIEGTVSLKYAEEVETIFNNILGWYRDLQLLSVNGNRDYLMHPDYEEHAVQAVQRGAIRDLDSILKAIKQAKLAIERSTALNLVLERLLLSD